MKRLIGLILVFCICGAVGAVDVFRAGQPPEFRRRTADGNGAYRIRDWRGRECATGSWHEETLRIPPLNPGYYTLETPGGGEKRAFAVVADPVASRGADSVVNLNTSQTWLAWRYLPSTPESAFLPGAAYETAAELAGLSGARYGREFFGWKEIEPEPGKFQFEKYDYNVDLLNRNGVSVLGVWRDSPGWARRNPGDGENVAPALFPDDLAASYRFARKLAEHYQGRVEAWEYWNEPDAGFSTQSAWDFASASKAALLGLRDGDSGAQLLLGSMCLLPVRAYVDVALENDLGEYFDVFNYHTYAGLTEYPRLIGEIRAVLTRHGLGGIPVHFTETGTYAEGAARLESGVPGIRMQTPEQELLIAEFLPKSIILLQSLGIARVFPFVLAPFNEGGGSKDWGLLRRDYSPRPGYVALAALAARIGNARYVGEVAAPEGIRAFLYRLPDGGRCIAFWSVSELDLPDGAGEKIDWALPAADDEECTLYDLCGTPDIRRAAGGRIPLVAERYVQYLTGLAADPPLKRAAPGAGELRRPNPQMDRSVVLKTVLSDDFSLSAARHSVDFRRTPARLQLEIFNLSGEAKRGVVRGAGAAVAGLPAEVELPPFGRVSLELECGAPDSREGTIVFSGEFNQRPISRLSMRFFRVAGETFTEALSRSGDPGAWRVNSSGNMTVGRGDGGEAVRFETDFHGVDNRWANPEFILQLPQESAAKACGMRFEIRRTGDFRVLYPLVMLVDEEGGTLQLGFAPPSREWETRQVFFDDVRDPGAIRLFRIGLCTDKDDFVGFEIRGIHFIYPGKKE